MVKWILLIILLGCTDCFGQSVFQETATSNNVYLHYENDLFARTDRYYTQGFRVGMNWYIDGGNNSSFNYQTEIRQNVFTPSIITSDSLLDSDRPYAATLSARIDGRYTDDDGAVFGAMEIGIIGPAAGGKQMQTGIHKATDNFLPLGWQHQINNGLILDLFGGAEKSLVNRDKLQMHAGFQSYTGTFRATLEPFFKMAFGNRKSGWITGYWLNNFSGILYNGYLQGSLIGKKSEYKLCWNEINHFVYQSEVGLLFKIKKIGLGFNYCLQTKTFKKQLTNAHFWGGIRLNYDF